MLIKNNIKHNSSFSGVYSLESNNQNFRRVILEAYVEIKDGGIIMSHPAVDIDIKDPISQSRVKEFAYFNSKQALKNQKDHDIILQ